jgi:hypothetical protein
MERILSHESQSPNHRPNLGRKSEKHAWGRLVRARLGLRGPAIMAHCAFIVSTSCTSYMSEDEICSLLPVASLKRDCR